MSYHRLTTHPSSKAPGTITRNDRSRSAKSAQWQAFLRKNALDNAPLATVVDDLRVFLLPVLAAIAAGRAYNHPWFAGAGWKMP